MLAGTAYDGRFSNVHGTIQGLNGLLSLCRVSGSEKHNDSTCSEGPGSSEAGRLRGGEATLTVAPKNFTSSPKERAADTGQTETNRWLLARVERS